jgi:spore coat protein U-like protein
MKHPVLQAWRSVAMLIALFLAAVPALALNCGVSSTALVFGDYEPMTPVPLDAAGEIVVRCRQGPGVFRVELGPGSSLDQLARSMAGAGSGLAYNLFVDATRLRIWGDGNGGTSVVTRGQEGSGNTTYRLPVYGRIAASQDPYPGSYSDSIVISVFF